MSHMCLEFIIFACIPLMAIRLNIIRLVKHVKLCLMQDRHANNFILPITLFPFKTVHSMSLRQQQVVS